MRAAPLLALLASTALADVTIEPPVWQSTPGGILMPASTQVRIPGGFMVEAPGSLPAAPQYWKVIESQPQRPARVNSGGGASPPVVVSAPRRDQRFREFRTSVSGVDVWLRIPSVFVTLPDVKIALPDPIGQPGRPPVLSTLAAPQNPSSSNIPGRTEPETPYERSMYRLYPGAKNSPAGWVQRRDQVLSAPADQRTSAVQNLVRDAAMAAKIKNAVRPHIYSIPRVISQPDPVTRLHELDPELTRDDSLAGRQAREAARVDNLVGFERAEALAAQGDFAAARTELIAVTALNPEDAVALQALTVLHLRAGDDFSASETFANAIGISPIYASPDYLKWGVAAVQASDAATRLTAVSQRNIGRDARNPLLLAASIRASQGPAHFQVAQRLLNKAAQADPGENTESLVLSLAAQWKLQTPARIGNRPTKPASDPHE